MLIRLKYSSRAMNTLISYFSLSWWKLLIGIILSNYLIVWLSSTFLINDIVFYNTYSEQLSYERSLKLFESMNNLAWVSYAFLPFLLLVKFSLISLLLYIGIVFFNKQDKVSLGMVFKVIIASELIFIIASLVKFLWFYFFAGNYDLNDLGFFYPLSLINLFDQGEVNKMWTYPLQTINLFHVGYIFFISYGLNKVCVLEKADAEKIVLVSYLPGLALWISLIMFLTIDATL